MKVEDLKQRRIGVLMGGRNAEHDVSMKTGAAISAALRNRGYQVVDVVADTDLPEVLAREKVEVAFVALHGLWGEDGCVQGLLEVLRIPYTGSGVLASALSMNKVMAKAMFQHHGLPVIEDFVVTREKAASIQHTDLPFSLPVVVKPSCEGSSVGTHIVRSPDAFCESMQDAARFAGDVLVERYLKGREIQVAVLDDLAMGAIEVRPAEEFYNYKAKYGAGAGTQYLFPAPLEKEQMQRALDMCLHAHRSLGCRGVSRVDSILSEEDGEFYLLEVNTIPGMTEASLVPKIAAGLGLSFEDLAERILSGAALKA
jgi:D-alanine-D-alanine ligase